VLVSRGHRPCDTTPSAVGFQAQCEVCVGLRTITEVGNSPVIWNEAEHIANDHNDVILRTCSELTVAQSS